MTWWPKTFLTRSIRRQMILGIALVHAVLMTIFVTDAVLRQRNFLQRQSVHNTENLARTLAANSISWVLADDVIGLEEVVLSQVGSPDLLYVMILAPDGRILGHSDATMVGKYVSDPVSIALFDGPEEPRDIVLNRDLVDIAVPIMANDRLIGWARVGRSQQLINDGLRIITRDGIIYTLLAIIVGSLFAILMARGITRGLDHLMRVAERLRAGDEQARSRLDRHDELGTLGTTLNAMIDAVADEQERLRVTLYSIADGVITTDVGGRVVLVNEVAERLLGLSRDEAAGQVLDDIYAVCSDADGTPAESLVHRVLSGAAAPESAVDVYVRDPAGRLRTIAQTCAAIRDRRQQIVGVVLVIRDITDEKEMQDQVFKARSLESLGLLAGGIAHDFNNILTSILGNISEAQTFLAEDSEVLGLLASAENASFQARDLTQQLLTFAKGGDPVRRSHSLAAVIRDTAGFVLSGSNVRCYFDFAADLAPVFVDRGQIGQVIQNLILNATQAMRRGGIVKVRAENLRNSADLPPGLPPGNLVKLEISDTGEGIPEHLVNQIFDPYFSTKQQGSGLGLAVTYSIVARHNGHIEVASQTGRGTIFTIYLPAATEKPLAVQDVPDAAERAQGAILIVDDDPRVRRTLRLMLGRAGYEVTEACDGAEAVEMFETARSRNEPVDLVITDLTIPGGMGGQEAAAQILARDPQAKLVVSSGYSNDPVLAHHTEYGFLGYLCKPFTRQELLRVVQAALIGQ
jgi:PAS domain S-box-containing protein